MKIKHSMIITFIGGFYVFGGIIILLSLFFNGSAINIIFGLPDVPDHIVKLCVSVIYIPAGYFYIKRSKIAYWIILVCAVITFLISADLTTITGMQPYIGNLIYSLFVIISKTFTAKEGIFKRYLCFEQKKFLREGKGNE